MSKKTKNKKRQAEVGNKHEVKDRQTKRVKGFIYRKSRVPAGDQEEWWSISGALRGRIRGGGVWRRWKVKLTENNLLLYFAILSSQISVSGEKYE